MDFVKSQELCQHPQEKMWIKYIRNRIAKRLNFVAIVNGNVGSGKSYSCLKICSELDTDFNVDRIAFSPQEFHQILRNQNLKPGSCIIFEECGVGLSSKNWQSKSNKVINFLFQTFRNRRLICLLNTPHMDFLDASSRKLLSAQFQVQGVDLSKQETRIKPLLLQYNGDLSKFYRRYLRVQTPLGQAPIKIWRVGKPDGLISLYEEKKRAFQEDLSDRIEADLAEDAPNHMKMLTEIQEQTLDLLRAGKNVGEIAKELGKAHNSVYATIELIRKRGYRFEPQKEGAKIVRYVVHDPK